MYIMFSESEWGCLFPPSNPTDPRLPLFPLKWRGQARWAQGKLVVTHALTPPPQSHFLPTNLTATSSPPTSLPLPREVRSLHSFLLPIPQILGETWISSFFSLLPSFSDAQVFPIFSKSPSCHLLSPFFQSQNSWQSCQGHERVIHRSENLKS